MEIFLEVVSILLIVSVFLSLVKEDYWVFKILEYPRFQKLILIIMVAASWAFFWPLQKIFHQIIFGGLFVSIIFLLYKIWPYTPFSKKEMLRVKSADVKNEFKVFSANVYQDNKQYDRLLQQIKSTDPDLIFLLETNKSWENATKELEKDYPYKLSAPLENTYGLLFFSRLPLENPQIKFLVKNDIPSIDAVFILRGGEKIQLWGLHPEPPAPKESLYSTAKDKELMKVALKAKDCVLPCIVIGDFNDVAWSHTTELFRKTGELLDPRRGRGFYNTFSAHNWFLRFPLDYVFCSKEFGIINMQRLPKNGSDHFATTTHLALNKKLQKNQSPPKADKEELQEAQKIASQPLTE
jgi:endonuclease/exonuclease/phosphatase (EEP) superfamily protein YafD